MTDLPPLQYRIVTGALRIAGGIAAHPLVRRLWVLGLYAGICLIMTFQFVRNYSNPMLPEARHQHDNGELHSRHKSGLNGKSWATFPKMIEGTAYKPYVNRLLMPVLIRSIASVLPDEPFERLSQAERYQLSLTEIGLDWEPQHTKIYVIGVGLMYFFLLGFAYAVCLLFRTVYDGPWWLEVLSGASALLILSPCFELYGSYIYDFSGLCLFTIGLSLIVRQKWILFFIVYTLATMNKETTVLLTFAFCMYHTFSGKLSWKTFFSLALAQSILFIAIKVLIGLQFHDNPGGAVEFHLLRNLSKLPRWGLGQIAFMAGLGYFVLRHWPEKSLFLRSSLIMLVPLITLTFAFGYFDELRDYYEAFPSLLLLAGYTLAKDCGVQLTVRA